MGGAPAVCNAAPILYTDLAYMADTTKYYTASQEV